MYNRNLLIFASTALLLAACSSSASDNDGGQADVAAQETGTDARTFYLTNGDYLITAASDVDDGCKIGVDKMVDANGQGGLIGVALPITVDNVTGDVSWGKTQGSPAVPSLGKGNIQANHGTLTMTTKITADPPSMCTLNRMVTSDITVTADYTFTAKVTRTDSMRMMCDTTDVTGDTCTSTWTWTVTKQTATADGGATGG